MRDSGWPSPQRQGSPGGQQRGQRRQVERRCRGSVRRARRGCPVRGVGEEVCGSATSLRLGPRGRPAGALSTAGAAPQRRDRARAGFGVAGTSQTQSRPSQPERRRLRADPGDARPRDTDRAAGSHAALTTRRDNDLGGRAGDCGRLPTQVRKCGRPLEFANATAGLNLPRAGIAARLGGLSRPSAT